jgi:hypothetical protein
MNRRLPFTERRFSFSALAVATLLFCVALVVFLVLGGTPERRVVSVLSSTTNGAQEKALAAYLEHHGAKNCTSTRQDVKKGDFYIARAQAIASVSCETIGTGPDSVEAVRFKTEEDLKDWGQEHHDYVAGSGSYGPCLTGPGEAQWTNAAGAIAGRIYCEELQSGGGVAWTDLSRRTGYYATSDSAVVAAIVTWWHRHIRGQAQDEEAGLRVIRSALGGAVKGGLADCSHIRDPLADAGLECDRVIRTVRNRGRTDGLTAFHFHDDSALDAFFKNYEYQFRAPGDSGDEFCDTSALVSTTYDYKGDTAAGRIFCFPDDTNQYIVWTIDSRNLAVLIHRRDQNEKALYRAWQVLGP